MKEESIQAIKTIKEEDDIFCDHRKKDEDDSNKLDE